MGANAKTKSSKMNPVKTKKAPTAGVLKWQSHLMPVTHRDYEKTKATTPWFCQHGGYSETCYFWKVSSGNPSNTLVYPFPLGEKKQWISSWTVKMVCSWCSYC